MNVLRLDHFNIAGTAGLIARCREFYIAVLGLTDGPRPTFTTPGNWLYAGGHPIVHLSVKGAASGPGSIDHVALSCQDVDSFLERLDRLGEQYRLSGGRGRPVQIFLLDPSGLKLELNFGPESAEHLRNA